MTAEAEAPGYAPSSGGPRSDTHPLSRLPSFLFRVPHWLWAVLAYALLTVFMTWPIAANLATEVPGGGDAWQHIWNLWWVKHALLTLHTNPYHTDLLYYPDGVNLYFHTLVLTAGLTAIPLQLAGLSLITSYNLILLSTYVLAGLGAFLLCRYLTRNSWASFVGGLVFAFAPYHSAHLFGHMNLASLQWIPFYVLLLLKAIGWPSALEQRDTERVAARGVLYNAIRNPWSAVGAGALLAVNAYTEWTYAIFLVLFTGVILAWRVLLPSERRAVSAGIGWPVVGARLVLIVVTFMVLTAPIFFPTLAEARQGYAQQPPDETLFYSADLVNGFLPSELHPIWGGAAADTVSQIPPYLPLKNTSERDLFLGYTVLVVAAWGLWRLRRDRRVVFWAFVAALMWLLSLGPVLQVLGKTVFTSFLVKIPLPYLLLYKLPLFSIMRTPARFTVLVMLALAVLVAYALRAIANERQTADNRRRAAMDGTPLTSSVVRRLSFIVIPVLILFEFLAVYPMVPPGWNVPIYQKIAAQPGNFALLELPIRPFGDYMAYQTIHGKPIIGGYLSRQPPYPLLDQNNAIHYLLDATAPDDPIAASIEGGVGERSLRDLGVKYVIIRWWAFTAEQKTAMQIKLTNLLARPPDLSYPSDQVDVWQLSP
ncbi:MAG TPA: hypothetical protein VLQ48_11235 [Chloroflexia bacterium]|nr:hypothetical protein [Chloroflexia bacterium]